MLFNSVVPEAGLQGQERTSGGWFSLLDQENEKVPCCTSAGQDPALPGLLGPGVTVHSRLLSSSWQLSFVCNLLPLNKAMQNPLIAFNHFPVNCPGSRALFKAYRLKSISTKTFFWSARWKSGGSSKKKSSLESVLPTLSALQSGVGK